MIDPKKPSENVVVFALDKHPTASPERATYSFVRGIGAGKVFADMEPSVLYTAESDENDLLARAAECLRDKNRDELDVFLIDKALTADTLKLSDWALAHIGQVVYDEFGEGRLSPAEDEALVEIQGVASPLLISLTQTTADLFSVAGVEGGDNDAMIATSGRWTIYPVRIRLETTELAPARLFPLMRKAYVSRGKRLEQPNAAALNKAEDRIQTWIWDEVAPGFADPLLPESVLPAIEAAAVSHPLAFANGDESRLMELIRWALDLDAQTIKERHSPYLSSLPNPRRNAMLTATFEEKQAGIRCSQLAKATRIILQEILVWAWPRGRVVRGFATNRASSALHGPVLRNIAHDGTDLSAHQILAAHTGLSEFLEMRGFEPTEIGTLLAAA